MEKAKLTKFTVNRDAWDRGREEGGALLSSYGYCCLGFLGLACGLEDNDLKGNSLPEETMHSKLAEDENPWPASLVIWRDDRPHDRREWKDTHFTNAVVTVNDDCSISDAEREEKLTELFASQGIEVEFVGKVEVSDGE